MTGPHHALDAANAIIAQQADEAAKMQREIDRLRLALEKVRTITRNRDAIGMRFAATVERVASEALEGKP